MREPAKGLDGLSWRRFEIAFVVGGLHTETSGVARIVCDLANALGAATHPVSVYAAVWNGTRPAAHLLHAPNRLVTERGRYAGRLAWSPALRRRLRQELPAADVVHNHSLWMLPNHYASALARRLGKPVVFTAHGFLEPWAFGHSRWKKRLAAALFQRKDLRAAACVHVNSEAEAEGVRAFGYEGPVAVIPNGVDLAPFEAGADTAPLLRRHPELRGKRVALFLSRLHGKKGIVPLLEAWAAAGREREGWHLLVAGPDDGAEARARGIASARGLDGSVTFAGPLLGEQKPAAFRLARFYVLPSQSEGFSMALLEALAAGLPVLYTRGCNFPEAARAGAGIEIAPEELPKALARMLTTPPEELSARGERARRLVERHYTWRLAAERLLATYEWLARGAAMPDFVIPGAHP